MRNKNRVKDFAVKNSIFTTLVILFFLSGILVFYVMLYNGTRERIVLTGELNASTSAEQIDKYLSTGVDTLRLAGYALDNMIRDETPSGEILRYMNSQSVAIRNITSGDSPGLYGYINGEYLSGTGWVPVAGYDATSRPWYIEASAGTGRVAVVGPYLDMRTDGSIITLTETLCDVKSVIAMDFSMDRLQSITEDTIAQGDSYAEIILDREYEVIAHSDREEVGKNYLAQDGTFGRALVEKLRDTDEGSFSLKYDGTDYIVYTTAVANDWFCLSVIDATVPLSQLKTPLIFMIAAALAFIAVQVFILVRDNRNKEITQQLTENLTQAENTISEMDNQIGEISRVAYRDALTRVGSKTAFDSLSAELAERRRNEPVSAAVVMMDVNGLKNVNDLFGHDAGDQYLCGCCRIICETFKHSPVFRIGGDEFVAVLQSDDFENRTVLMDQLNAAFDASYAREDLALCERYSVSAGIADYEPADDTIDDTLIRADKAMYNAKRAFQVENGIYR